jgi:hypothetical protein
MNLFQRASDWLRDGLYKAPNYALGQSIRIWQYPIRGHIDSQFSCDIERGIPRWCDAVG